MLQQIRYHLGIRPTAHRRQEVALQLLQKVPQPVHQEIRLLEEKDARGSVHIGEGNSRDLYFDSE